MSNQQRYGCYIGNIDRSVPLEALRRIFAQCGTIVDCSLNGRDTDPFRYGFIDFSSAADRERALKFDGTEVGGRPLKVGVSRGNVSRQAGPGQDGPGAGMGGGMPMGGGMGAPMAPPRPDPSMMQLLQGVQSGAIPFAQLAPDQQRQLSSMMQAAPMPYGGAPPQFGGFPQGGYGMAPMHRGFNPGMSRRPQSANPPPSEETVALRAAQRRAFFDVIRKEADKYVEKKGKSRKSGSDSDSSSDDEEADKKKSRSE